MDHLKEGIGLRGYGQRDPLTEYKKEAFDMFQEMIGSLKETAVEQLFKVRMSQEETPATRVAQRTADWQESRGGEDGVAARPAAPRAEPRAADGQKVGRNDPCPCGSGKKYKKCCLLKGAA
jgi:preprotein translocase subunit SecA